MTRRSKKALEDVLQALAGCWCEQPDTPGVTISCTGTWQRRDSCLRIQRLMVLYDGVGMNRRGSQITVENIHCSVCHEEFIDEPYDAHGSGHSGRLAEYLYDQHQRQHRRSHPRVVAP